ncbi:hypothetical protein OG413_04530 [Streptomyces sp. NBC_01433]|uniref:hypothetical protein n=1 Tax=Streptomyces sp. NBC_01433 TaxID=2903864 RepID=UPI0022517E3C|nr:hypothetical protein [Streptomyces sp. NBC_01433]MCX4674594.1 hypothetical protein [Streptomyces sp. NBC_01433]
MTDETPPRRTPPSRPRQRKQMLLRLDPAVHDALARWASDELRSANAQIEFLLRRALAEAGRLPGSAAPIARRGRPPKSGPQDRPGGTQDRPGAAQDRPGPPKSGPSGD